MKIVSGLIQGSPEWHRHRAIHFNASDAPAMLGVSPYKSRSELIEERASPVDTEIDAYTQRRFDEGHRAEALARPLAESIIGEELYPITGTSDCGLYSASFDGLTLDGMTVFEHKLMNESLRYDWDQGNGWHLPEHYRVQMEHQLMVSGAERVLFMASEWNADDTLKAEKHCWYTSDPQLRARVIAGWEQFAADANAYILNPRRIESAAPIAAPIESFGALSLRVEGRVIASNLDAFRAGAEAFISRLPKPAELQTDQDFADAEGAVKACAEAESRIKAATESALAQMSDVDAVLRTASTIAETIRSARLALGKAVKSEKESRKLALVRDGVDSVRSHYATVNATLGEHALGIPAALSSDIGASIKGLRTLTSIRDAIDTAVARAKIDASQHAERVRASIAALAEASAGFETLFADRVSLCATKAPDDIRNLAAARIAEHKAREEERKAAEAAKASQGVEARAAAEPTTTAANPSPAPVTSTAGAARTPARLKLGEINARIAPLSITADGLAQLGINSVGNERSAKLYDNNDWPAICDAIIALVSRAAVQKEAA